MDTKFKEFCEEIESDIQNAYTGSVTLDEAEKLAAKFLHAMIQIGNKLRETDLDVRMRKTGLKSIKAAVYLEEAKRGDKKPSDVMLQAIVDSSSLVIKAQQDFDTAEVERNELENYLSVSREAHLYYRGMSKGRFDG